MLAKSCLRRRLILSYEPDNALRTLATDCPGAEEQRRLLEEEGVEFNEHDRVDLSRFGWIVADTGSGQPQLF